jgi:hypothetical protein
MEYTKPELVLTGQAESLVLGSMGSGGDPNSFPTSSRFAPDLEFED